MTTSGLAYADEEPLSLALNVTGTVAQRCELSGGSNPSPSLQLGTTSTIEFKVDCNTPFIYSLRSKNGGLEFAGAPNDPSSSSDFNRLLNYDTKLSVPLEQGDINKIEDRCSSAELKLESAACEFGHSGSSIAIAKTAKLEITPQISARKIPLAGHYSDVITIEVSAK